MVTKGYLAVNVSESAKATDNCWNRYVASMESQVIMVACLPSSRGPTQLPDGATYLLSQWPWV